MATRSTIAMEFADGTVQQIYCHWDGYLEHNGKILFNHYVDPYKTRELIDMGGISSLCNTIEETKQGAYHFWRGEELRVEKFNDFQDYLAHHQYEEYEYILRKDGHWYVQAHDDAFVMLKSALADAQDLIAQEETEE
jgi:hypothetical protein